MDLCIKTILQKTAIAKTSASTCLSFKSSAAFIKDVKIAHQDRKNTVGKLSLSHTGVVFKGLYFIDIAYYQGLDWFVSKKPAQPILTDQPTDWFKKFNLHALWFRPFTIFQKQCHYQCNFTWQYTKDLLFNDEQFSATQQDKVRGFAQPHAQDQDQGLCLKNEVSMKNPLAFGKILAPLQLFMGLDFAYLYNLYKTNLRTLDFQHTAANLSSWSIGCRYHSN